MNLHQIDAKDDINRPLRIELENHMIGLDLNETVSSDLISKVHEVRPKYGFLDVEATSPEESARIVKMKYYGNIVAVIKDAIKARATWTSGDSLNIKAQPTEIHSFAYHGD